jgi:uncharacterized repeat protein (TIGR01451 family)
LVFALLLAFLGLIALLFSFGSSSAIVRAQGPDDYSVYYVAPGGVCNGWAPCYEEIQAAVDAVDDPGDNVKVAEGTYTDLHHRNGLTQVVYISKSVTIQGGYTITNWNTSYPTTQHAVLDAQGQGRVIYVSGDITVSVEGLDVTGGDATGTHSGGIAIREAIAAISRCRIFSNTSDEGGGLGLYNAEATLEANTIAANTASHGGGLSLSGSYATLRSNRILSNAASGDGGGLCTRNSGITLQENEIVGNTAGDDGGGVYLASGVATLAANAITANLAHNRGGGIALYTMRSAYGGSELKGNVVSGNAAQYGGGMYLGDRSDVIIENNFVTENSLINDGQGAGVHIIESAPQLRHNTLARNRAASEGIYCEDGEVSLYNNILVSHTVGIRLAGSSKAWLDGTLWGTGAWSNKSDYEITGTSMITIGAINIWEGPDFVDPANGDYHINADSPARDAGILTDVDTDIDRQVRHMGLAYDIGADEFPDAALQLHQESSDSLINPGKTLTYTIFVRSAGELSATNVILTDALSTQQQLQHVESNRGTCVSDPSWGGLVTCTLGDMNVGETTQITLTTQVSDTHLPLLPHQMHNTITIRGNRTSSTDTLNVTLHNCHIRLNDEPTEWHTLQAALDATMHSTDVVKVAGTCTGITTQTKTVQGDTRAMRQMGYVTKTVTIAGGYSTSNWTTSNPETHPSVLDAQNLGRGLYIEGNNITVTVTSLTIRNGNAAEGGGFVPEYPWLFNNYGGGIYAYNAKLVISHCIVFSNTAEGLGGGLYLEGKNAILFNNMIAHNSVRIKGGGMFVKGDNASLISNVVSGNIADGHGGGALLWGKNYLFNRNHVISNVAGTDGGGVSIAADTNNLIFSNNVIASNIANDDGGGVDLYGSENVRFDNNWFVNNKAVDRGAGLLIGISHSQTMGGQNAGLWTAKNGLGSATPFDIPPSEGPPSSSAALFHNTIADNINSEAICVGERSTLVMSNTVIAGHNVGIYATDSAGIWADHTLWWNNTTPTATVSSAIVTTTNDLYGDPAFVDPTSHDYHLGGNSAAIDAGIDVGINTDIDGEARPQISGYDIGADEFVIQRDVVLAPENAQYVNPGETIRYIHLLTNTGNYTDYFDLQAVSLHGWSVALQTGGQSSGTGYLPLRLQAGATATLSMSLTVPFSASGGTLETTVLSVTSQADQAVQALVVNTTTVNAVPTADAGADKSVIPSDAVLLDGRDSADPDGHGPLSYQWAQIGGPFVILQHTDRAQAAFQAPPYQSILTFTLNVTDSLGLGSTPDDVVVYVGIEPAEQPTTPTLLFPPDETVTTTRAITLKWQAGTGPSPTGYNVKLDGPVITTTGTTSPTVLSEGVHTWTVRAYNDTGYSNWAPLWTVEVTEVLSHPAVPVLLSPPNGTVTTTPTVTLSWQAEKGPEPTGYNVELDGMVTTTTRTILPTVLSTGVHTWRVLAYNDAGYSDWTSKWTMNITNHFIYLPLVMRGVSY